MSCRQAHPRATLLRVVREKSGGIFVGGSRRQGRSAYVCDSRDCLHAARKQNKLGKVLNREIPESIWEIFMRSK